MARLRSHTAPDSATIITSPWPLTKTQMNIPYLISQKRDGRELTRPAIEYLIEGFTEGSVPDYQMAAFAMAVYFQGLSFDETVDLTRAMRDSGRVMNWPPKGRPKVDKHSTGGIGDKISIPLAPALAACGLDVPMVSGRGLGPTGGTLDKLESIAGFRCDLSTEEFQSVVENVGCVISGASEQIAPADKKLYALRDVTATVPAIGLITASILSKKLSEGLDALVLDVKWGSGAFMKSYEQATELAETLVKVANELGTKTTAIMTDMNRPLGRMIGNSVEIDESLQTLQGSGPADVRELTVVLGGQLLADAQLVNSPDEGNQKIAQSLDNGSALKVFEKMVDAQNGNLDKLTQRANSHPFVTGQAGYLKTIDCENLGLAVIELGGGRKQLGDQLDFSTGIEMLKSIGDYVEADEPVANIFVDEQPSIPVTELLRDAICLDQHPVEAPPLVNRTITLETI